MVDISSFTGKFRAGKDSSNEGPSPRIIKRSRESLVCNTCRRSKLRCDRAHPCNSCVKRGEAAGCSYQRAVVTRNGTNSKVQAEDRLLHLEAVLKQLMEDQTSSLSLSESTNHLVIRDLPLTPPELRESKDGQNEQGTNGRYVGSTHWSAVLDDIQELKSILGNVRAQESTDDAAVGIPSRDAEVIFGLPSNYDIQQIVSRYLPLKLEVDRFLSIYFRGEGFVLPFIHTYYFQRQYQEFWADPANVNPLWLSILFSICYLASLVGQASGLYDSALSESVNKHPDLQVAAGQCLVLGQYNRPQKYTVEALTMYAQCKNLKSLDPSREVGAVLSMAIRLGIEMGYHRDPDSFGSFSVFEGEMRRRVWSVCIQMNLMISFQLGLPSNICLDNSDTKSPRNLLDSDFDVDTKVLPTSRPDNEATKILWFIIKDRQMTHFSKVCRNALSFTEISELEIESLDQGIREMYNTIPEVLRTRPLSQSLADHPFVIMTRYYIDFIYLKSICVLHRKYITRGNIFSIRSCVDAGMKLVSEFMEMYREFEPGGQLFTERWMMSNFTVNDYLLGIMVLCLVVHVQWKKGGQHIVIDDRKESEILGILEQALVVCMEISGRSKDSIRVSHAIRLTLNNSRKATSHISTQILPVPVTSSMDIQPIVKGDQVSSTAFSGLIQGQEIINIGEEATFGALDPFNFAWSDLDNIDWAAFDLPDISLPPTQS